MEVLNKILELKQKNKKGYFVLIDPDKKNVNYDKIIKNANKANIFGILIGGSSYKIDNYDNFICNIKKNTNLPIVLFPGSHFQIDKNADAVLLLSLLNTKNVKYLIGEHIEIAKTISQIGIEVINTAYIIISNSVKTSVIKQTGIKPLNPNDTFLIEKYFYAVNIMGFDIVYIEGGSGTDSPVPLHIIKMASQIIKKPIIVGGGIKDTDLMDEYLKNGAHIIVTGNIIEKYPEIIKDFQNIINKFNYV